MRVATLDTIRALARCINEKFAKSEELPSKVSSLINDVGYIVDDSPADNLPRVRQGGKWVVQQPAEVIYNKEAETAISITSDIYPDFF